MPKLQNCNFQKQNGVFVMHLNLKLQLLFPISRQIVPQLLLTHSCDQLQIVKKQKCVKLKSKTRVLYHFQVISYEKKSKHGIFRRHQRKWPPSDSSWRGKNIFYDNNIECTADSFMFIINWRKAWNYDWILFADEMWNTNHDNDTTNHHIGRQMQSEFEIRLFRDGAAP
jgi:hypothetical protein